MKGGVSYAAHFRAALKASRTGRKEKKEEEKKEEKKEEDKEEEKEKKKEGDAPAAEAEVFNYKFTGWITEMSEEASLNFDKINNSLMADGSLFKFVQLFKELNFPLKTLEDLGLIELEQKLSFLLQALGNKKDRKESVDSGLFTTSYSLDESIQFIQNLYTNSVNKEVLAFRSKLLAELSADEGSKKAAIFSMTSDLEEAAGCVYGLTQGGASFPLFSKLLQSPGVPEIIAKIKMLTFGSYNGVKLIFDTVPGPSGFVMWKANKKRVNKIWSANKDTVPKEAWQEAFPDKFEYFEHLYLRSEGVFVPYTKPRKNVVDPRHWAGKNKKP